MKLQFLWDKKNGPIFNCLISNITISLCFCHRMKERSFPQKGFNIFCSRCMGILIGGVIGIISLLFSIRVPFLFSGLILIPLIVDGVTQAFFERESNNSIRFITGLIFGFGLVFCSFYAGIYLKTIL